MFTPNQHMQLELSPRFATIQTFSPLLQQNTICQACLREAGTTCLRTDQDAILALSVTHERF